MTKLYPFGKPAAGYRNRRERRENQPSPRQLEYFQQAMAALKQHPERIAIIAENLRYYQQQDHLPKSAKGAIKRFSYLLEVTQDPEEIERFVMEESYEGRKFRQLPLLLKGVADNRP